MTISITVSKVDGFSSTFTQNWDDATTDRVIDWAQATFLNDDGTQPGPSAACNRMSKSWIQGLRDATRKKENDDNVAAVPPPADIPVDPI
jgi:hypothetical protein